MEQGCKSSLSAGTNMKQTKKKQMEDFLEVHIPKQSASHMHLLKRVRKRD